MQLRILNFSAFKLYSGCESNGYSESIGTE